MICPYTVDIKDVTQWNYEYDEEGRQKSATQINISQRIEHKCKRDDCAAWKKGECRYYEGKS